MDNFKLYLKSLEQQYDIKFEEEYKFDKRTKDEIVRFYSDILNKSGRQREYRFDFACPDLFLAIEIDGGVWMKTKDGGHVGHAGGTGVTRDIEKTNLAQMLGWDIYRFTYQQQFLYVQELLEHVIKEKLNKDV